MLLRNEGLPDPGGSGGFGRGGFSCVLEAFRVGLAKALLMDVGVLVVVVVGLCCNDIFVQL